MLKNVMMLLSMFLANVVLAQSSSVQSCRTSLEYYFLASADESDLICRQDSSQEFVSCMEKKANQPGRARLATEVAPECSRKRFQIPIEINDSKTYTTFKSCDSRMQIYARMRQGRAIEICNQNPSEELQKCYIDVVQGAKWHPELAIQYCQFGQRNHKSRFSKFKACLIEESQYDSSEYRVVEKCHDRVLQKPSTIIVKKEKEITPVPMTPVEPYVVKSPEIQAPEKTKTGAEKVPAPVQIRVQEGAKAENIQDQPLEAGSTSNAEALPLD